MRSATITFGLAAATASLLLAGACSSTTTGSGSPAGGGQNTTGGAPTTAGSSPAGGDGNTFGAPKVTTPMDTTKYQQNPCSAMTPTQLQQFGVTGPGTLAPQVIGPGCSWKLAVGSVGIVFDVRPANGTTHTGLADIYEANPSGSVRRLPDLDGQPAVGPTTPDPSGGICDIYVGATDSVVYHLTAVVPPLNPAYADPCGYTQQIALAATMTMKSAA